ncbi:MAG: SGNH/GDSL hydrolase family protein [bacterium]|nr:SGNH/GDSL hydrolase family protein [bacterium]
MSPRGRKACAVALGVALAAAAGEAALRLFAPFPDYSAGTIRSFPDRYHPLLGYAGIPNLDRLFVLPDFSHRIVNNSKGFRDRERSPGKGGGRRMVVLGDSTAWGWGVEAAERFSDVMERRLDGWEVINLAHPGYSTDRELLVLETEGLRYRPDLVLLLFDRNDVVEGNNARVIDGRQPKPFFEFADGRLELRNAPVPFDRAYWAAKTALAAEYGDPRAGRPGFWRRSHLANWIAFRAAHPSRRRREEEPADPRALEEEMELTKAILRRIDRVCRENGARLVVADLPSHYTPLLRDFCRREGIPHVDLAAALSEGLRPVSHRRVGHWTPRGHRLVAAAIIGALERERLLEGEGGGG